MIRSATISPCGLYRYDLRRVWGDPDSANLFAVCGANPSTADAQLDDPTIRRCIGFAQREGCDGLVMVNVRAFRATDPGKVPVSRLLNEIALNDQTLRAVCQECPLIVCAWGTVADERAVAEAMDIFDDEMATLMCFGQTMAGHPKHPLYLPKTAPLVPFGRRAA
jgi:hypothetical protein